MTQLNLFDDLPEPVSPTVRRYLDGVAELEAAQRLSIPRSVRGQNVYPIPKINRPKRLSPLAEGILHHRRRRRKRQSIPPSEMPTASVIESLPGRRESGLDILALPAEAEVPPGGVGSAKSAAAASEAAAELRRLRLGKRAALRFLKPFARHPILTNAAAFLGVELLMSLFPGTHANKVVGNQIDFFTGQSITDQMRERIRNESQQLLFQTKMDRIQSGIQANIQQIRQTNPELYLQLLVGRKLPRGAAVFGGGAKPDYLQAVAMLMSEGRIKKEDPPELQLSGTLSALQQMDPSGVKFRIR